MFAFSVNSNAKAYNFIIRIEPHTNLCVLQQFVDGEDYPRYIRMTGQQIKGIRSLGFSGSFTSRTIPTNTFSLSDGFLTIKCHENHQVITMPSNGIINILRYFDAHKQHIAHFDAQFRSWK